MILNLFRILKCTVISNYDQRTETAKFNTHVSINTKAQAGTQTEIRIQEAIGGIQFGLYRSANHAAKCLNIPCSTLHFRLNGRQTRIQSHESQQVFTPTEESELV